VASPADPFWLVTVSLSALLDVSTLRTAPACSRRQDTKYVHPRQDHEIMFDGVGWGLGGRPVAVLEIPQNLAEPPPR